MKLSTFTICVALVLLMSSFIYSKSIRSEGLNGKGIDEIVASMSLEEKAGQMALVAEYAIKKEDIGKKGIGGILSGGGGYPVPNTPENWRAMIESFQSEALKSKTGIPLLYGVDAVHGHNNVKGAVIFPHNIGLAAARNPELARETAYATAMEMLATGANWNFAPVLSLPLDLRWGRVYETFGNDPGLVGELGKAYVEGTIKAGALPTPKHFIGEGYEGWNTSKEYFLDQGNIDLSEEELLESSLEPFQKAIDSGALSIMVSRSSWQNERMSANKYLLSGLLKDRMGFKGFLVSDWGAIDQISNDGYHNIVASINAGIDMVMIPDDYESFLRDVITAVRNKDISEERIDDAVKRILLAKKSIGLFELPVIKQASIDIVGSDTHRDLAKNAVRESLVLLKNNGVLPIKDGRKIAVAGKGAHDIGLQSGGWTIEWQGGEGSITEGTSILDGLKKEFPESEIIFQPDGDFTLDEKADIGIAVIAETPYAEGVGDTDDLQLSDSHIKTIESVRQNSRKTILLILSGRPLIISEVSGGLDGIVMAWLPGTEGDGIAEVLAGKYDFKGRLPLDWPMSMKEVENKSIKNFAFKLGHGLRK
jgi:beta-glucosidase